MIVPRRARPSKPNILYDGNSPDLDPWCERGQKLCRLAPRTAQAACVGLLGPPPRVGKASMTEHYKEYGVVENAALKYDKTKWNKDDEDGALHAPPRHPLPRLTITTLACIAAVAAPPLHHIVPHTVNRIIHTAHRTTSTPRPSHSFTVQRQGAAGRQRPAAAAVAKPPRAAEVQACRRLGHGP